MITNKFAQKSIGITLDESKPYTDIFILLGGLNKALIVSSIQIIENKLTKLGYPKTLISKAKLIGIELLDNVLKHQSESPSITPYFELSLSKDAMKFITGNCVSKEDYTILKQRLNEYVDLTQEGVQEKYMQQLKIGKLDDKGNAGLGILTILKRSEKKYDYEIEKITDNEYYFNTCVKIDNQLKKVN